ncbi:hypothetical protein R80B4_03143 [Fibrobacteres bacterium R8-0-B4]
MKVFAKFVVIVSVCAAAAFSQESSMEQVKEQLREHLKEESKEQAAEQSKKPSQEQAKAQPKKPSTEKLAVYVTGSIPEEEKAVIGQKVLNALLSSNKYVVVERSEAFVKQLNSELSKQMSGDVADSEITAIGKQYGVQVICVVNGTPVMGAYSLGARLIEVESANVVSSADESCYIAELKDLEKISTEVARVLLGGKKDKKFKCADKPKAVAAAAPSAAAPPAPAAAPDAPPPAVEAPAAQPAAAAPAQGNNNTNNVASNNANNNSLGNTNAINVVVNTSSSAKAEAKAKAKASGSKSGSENSGRKSRTSFGVRGGYFNALTVDGYFSTITGGDKRLDLMMGYCGLFDYVENGDTVQFSAIEFVPAYGWQAGTHRTGALTAYFEGVLPIYIKSSGDRYGRDSNGKINKERLDIGFGIQVGLEVTLEDLILGLDCRPLYMFIIGKDFQYTVGASVRYRF